MYFGMQILLHNFANFLFKTLILTYKVLLQSFFIIVKAVFLNNHKNEFLSSCAFSKTILISYLIIIFYWIGVRHADHFKVGNCCVFFQIDTKIAQPNGIFGFF